MKSALYIRVSTNMQIDKDSLPLQKQDLINYSNYILGINDYVVFEDAGYSGKDTIRPAYQDMMNRIRKGEFTHLLVWKIDRISRNLLDFASMYDELREYNITFISKNEQFDTSSAMGEAMLKIILIFAELERKLTAERVYSVMISRAEKGLWNGANVPLGYKWSDDKTFPSIQPNEALTVEHIFKLYDNLQSSTYVMEELNNNNIPTKRGGNWSTKTVSDIIRNPFYKGTYRYNYRESARGKIKDKKDWILLDDNHPAIIDKDLWEQCNSIMDSNANKNTSFYRKNINTHLFSSLLVCSHCGKGMNATIDVARKDGFQPSIYRCQSKMLKQPCNSTKISTDVKIAPFVLTYIANIVKAQFKVNSKTTIKQLEKMLLNSNMFSNVAGIENNGLDDMLLSIVYSDPVTMGYEKKEPAFNPDLKLDTIVKDREKQERALERLNSLYLYSDDALSEKEYLIQKHSITSKLNEIDIKIKGLYKKDSPTVNDSSFLKMASYFVLNNEFMNKKTVDYRKLIKITDKGLLKDFINLIVKSIEIDNNVVSAITFANGITHRFIYKSVLQ